MNNTEQLIASLLQDKKPPVRLASPLRLMVRMALGLFVYAVIVAWIQELRPDLMAQLVRPLFLAECVSLLFIVGASLAASVYLVFPDAYQHEAIRKLPIGGLLVYGLVVLAQFANILGTGAMIDQSEGIHTFECTLCIIGVAVLPSILLAVLARKGATTQPLWMGAYVILTATALGCLLMRLVEAQDDPLHILIWHTIPMLVLAVVGAWVGKKIFKW